MHSIRREGGDSRQLIKEQGTLPYGERLFCFGLSSGKSPETVARRSGVMLWELVLCLLGWARWGKKVCPWNIKESATVIWFTGSHGGGMPPRRGQNKEGSPSCRLWRGFPENSIVGGFFGDGAPGSGFCPCPSTLEAGHRRPRGSPPQASCLRPRRPGFRTRRAGPADRASCRRADRPCGKGVPDIAPDPSLVPRAPAAGRRPGACPGAAAGRGGR